MPATHKHKFTAAMLAFVTGGLGLHRRYLGDHRWWWYALWLVVGMAVFASVGSKANFWVLTLALLPVWIGFAQSMGMAVTDDKRWDARYNPASGRTSRNGWNCVMLAIVVLLLSTVVSVTAIVLSAQYYYEAQQEAAQMAPDGSLPNTPSTK